VRLLGTLGFRFEVTHFGIFGPEQYGYLLFRRRKGLIRKVHRVGTHVGDVTGLVKPLGDGHRLAHRHTEFTAGLLLQSRGGKRCRRIFLRRFLLDVQYRKTGVLTLP